jgi:superfamily II DNA or RNA helicase
LCSGNGTKRYERFKDVGLVILDEAHYACTESYKAMVDFFRDGGAKVLGVTATAKRHDKKSMGQIFDDCCYQMGILDAIEDGWLVPVKVTCKQLENLDLSDVQTSNTFLGKDFNQKQLAEKLENPKVIYEICEAVKQETTGEKTAIFCQSVDEAQAVAELLVDKYGIKADWICADKRRCSDARRNDVMTRFCDEADTSLTHLANVGILTTGWDYPGLKCIVMARPTTSLPLFTQIFGRVTRSIERDGKPVVDFDGSDSASRKEAIAESSKPFGRVIDLVDVSLHHKICTSVDVLGGNWTLVKQQEVAELIRDKEGRFTLDELEEEHRKLLEQRREEQLRKQRAARQAAATFHDVEVNPFGGNRSNGRNGSQQIMATDKQRKYLWVLGIKDIDRLQVTKAQAGRMIGQLKSGMLIPDVRRVNRLALKD